MFNGMKRFVQLLYLKLFKHFLIKLTIILGLKFKKLILLKLIKRLPP